MLAQTDIDRAKAVDLLALIGTDTRVRKVANTAGGEFAGPCPFCGGHDRLRVQPERGLWWCRQCGGEHWQDAIAYVQKRDGVEFAEAVQRLTGGALSSNFKPAPPTHDAERPAGPPSAEWQTAARKVIAECEAALWSDSGAKARAWLHERGLNEETLHAWHIGYNAKTREIASVHVEHGIVIPCEIDDVLWYVKVRRPAGDPKYIQVKGGRSALFGADTLGAHDYAVLTEGEFDALLTWQTLQHATNPEWHKVGVATLGSAVLPQGFAVTWARYLLPVSRLLIAYDMDSAGEKGASRWSAITARALRVNVPKIRKNDKDLTDFHKSGGRILDLVTFEIAKDRLGREQMAHPAQVAHMATGDEPPTMNAELDDFTRQRDALTRRLDSLGDEVAAMRHALGEELTEAEREQHSPDYARKLAEWLEINESYMWVCDRIDVLDLTSRFAGASASCDGHSHI